MPALPVLITTSHNSGVVPYSLLADMLGPDIYHPEKRQARLDHLFQEGDPYTDALFFVAGAYNVNALISRFVVDLNRERDHRGPNGVIKQTDFQQNALYPENFVLSELSIEERLQTYYDPFYAHLQKMLKHKDILFFIDGHAMSAYGPALSPDVGKPRPALSMITGGQAGGEAIVNADPPSIPAQLAQDIAERLMFHFQDLISHSDVPQQVCINKPFDRGGIQQYLSQPNNPYAVPGFGLEINRNLYLQNGAIDIPIPGRIKELNKRFQAFVHELKIRLIPNHKGL